MKNLKCLKEKRFEYAYPCEGCFGGMNDKERMYRKGIRMRIYISGAITGTEDYMERFQKAEDKLTAAGHKVYNPAHANSYMPEGTTHKEYMKISFTLLDMAEAIYMLKGWEDSKGANQEYGYALAKGYAIHEE